MDCRVGCGACCIAPYISTSVPGMLRGKLASVRCAQLAADNRCLLFGLPERPAVCSQLRRTPEMCGQTSEQATTASPPCCANRAQTPRNHPPWPFLLCPLPLKEMPC